MHRKEILYLKGTLLPKEERVRKEKKVEFF